MAKESMKAREVKRAKTVAKYAEKRKALKEAGDYQALQKLPKKCFSNSFAQQMQTYRKTKGVYENIWTFTCNIS